MAPTPGSGSQDAITAQVLLSALTEFSARAGHDIIGPLNQAASLLTLYMRQARSHENGGGAHLLEFLQSSSERMESLTEGIRRYLEVASRAPHIAPADLNTSIRSALENHSQAVVETGAEVASDEMPVVPADADHMVTIFSILIGNSIRFRKPDAPPRIRISSSRAIEGCRVEVVDNGIGVEPEYRESLLLPFRRLGANAGAGLGLATAKLIAELHRGSIRMDAAPAGGTVVAFTLRPPNEKRI